jgi:hypothetical protein
MARSLVDNAETILRRILLFLHIQEAKCLLYFRHSTLLSSLSDGGESHDQHMAAHSKYVEAALQILQYQRTLYDETQISGRLYKDRWKLPLLLRAPCLLATAVLCSEIDSVNSNQSHDAAVQQRSQENEGNMHGQNIELNDITLERRDEIVQALHESCLVWTHLSEKSQEAQKAAEAVRSVLNKMHHTDMILSPAVDTGPILDMTINNSMMIPSNIVAGSSTGSMQSCYPFSLIKPSMS